MAGAIFADGVSCLVSEVSEVALSCLFACFFMFFSLVD